MSERSAQCAWDAVTEALGVWAPTLGLGCLTGLRSFPMAITSIALLYQQEH